MKKKLIKNGVLNISFGIILQLLSLIFGLVIPRIYIINYGSEVNGLLATINQVFAYIGIVESGVGVTALHLFYGSIASSDKTLTSQIFKTARIYYRKSGLYFLIIVSLSAIIFPFILNTEINKLSIFTVFVLNSITGLQNFFILGELRMLLQAEGKNYVNLLANTVALIVSNVVRLILLLMNVDFVIVHSVYSIFSLTQSLILVNYWRKKYTWIDKEVEPNFGLFSQKNHALVHQISSLIFSNTDIIILSIFTNLKVVSVYALYSLVYNIIRTLIGNISTGLGYRLGQEFSANKAKFIQMFNLYDFYFSAFIFATLTVTHIYILPFVKIYTQGATDIQYIDALLPYFFSGIYILLLGRTTLRQVIDLSGDFKNTKKQSILESLINLITSIVLVRYFGVYGVLIGTIVALIYRTNAIILYVNHTIIKRTSLISYIKWIANIITFGLLVYLNPINQMIDFSFIVFMQEALVMLVKALIAFFTLNSVLYVLARNYTARTLKTG